MRKAILLLVLGVSLIFPLTARAQGPTPPPNLIDVCYKEGEVQWVDCFREVGIRFGIEGVIALAVIMVVIFLFLTPGGKEIQEQMQEKWRGWIRKIPFFRPAPLPPAEIQRREAEYVLGLETSDSLRQPEEIAAQFDEYLNRLYALENPLKPSEDKIFVELESGLSIPPRIGLSLKVESNQTRSFVEQKTFSDLAEAINCVDENSGHPYPALALLGEPGAGKSTLLRKLARLIVQERIEDPSKHLPLFLSLGAHKSGSPLTFLRQHWKRVMNFDGLDNALAEGKVWMFLDGLNEIPHTDYDLRVTDWRTFLREHCAPGGNRALIACRIADYGEGVDVPRLMVHPMDDERMQDFLNKRNPDRADALWAALEKDRDEGRGAMYELAKVPFWLVMIARLSGREGLPRNRAELIGRFIREWLDYENQRDGGRPTSEIQRDAFTQGMTQLAWLGLSRSQNYTFRLEGARKILGAKQTALNVDDALGLARDCNLLSVESESVRFHHQLLQEYFAARELANRFSAGRNLTKLWKTPWRRWKFVQSAWDPLPPPPLTGWEEAIILAAGMLDAGQAENLALEILPNNAPLAARCTLESGMKARDSVIDKVTARLQADLEDPRVRLPARLAAGKALAKLGDSRLLEQRSEVELVEGRKTIFIAPNWVDVPAGSFRMGTTPAQSILLLFQRVTPTRDELNPHRVSLSAFKIARFPVTVAEYRCFMDAGGYQNDSYWKEENSLRWRNAPLPFEESYASAHFRLYKENAENILPQLDTLIRQGRISKPQAEAFREIVNSSDDDIRKQWTDNENAKRNSLGQAARPWLWDDRQYSVENQPVIGVSWYEACAYAAWLTELLRTRGEISEQEEVRLPTEAEWEKAARGNTGRLWSWGNIWRSAFANSLEGRVMQPSTVGAYPQNKSAYGVQDMIGNIWEWCLDWYEENAYRNRKDGVQDPKGPPTGSARVACGGSWFNNRDSARCSYRSGNVPDVFGNLIGFRLVCSPSSSLRSESLNSESLNPEKLENE